MAVRQVISANNVHKAHVVESGDNSGTCIYEVETAYEAGTMVVYDGTMYCTIVDIEATDTDTPLDAADKWALVIPTLMS